jgi:hypothetical protein
MNPPPIGNPLPDGAPDRHAEGPELRLGMRDGEPFAWSARFWGARGWSIAEGQPHFFNTREAAEDAIREWIEPLVEVEVLETRGGRERRAA